MLSTSFELIIVTGVLKENGPTNPKERPNASSQRIYSCNYCPSRKSRSSCLWSCVSEVRLTTDFTVAYYPTDLIPPTVLQIFCLPRISPFYKFHVHVRRFNIIDVLYLSAWS